MTQQRQLGNAAERRYLRLLRAVVVFLNPRQTFILGLLSVGESWACVSPLKHRHRKGGGKRNLNVAYLCPAQVTAKQLEPALAVGLKFGGLPVMWRRSTWEARVNRAVLDRIHADLIIVGMQTSMQTLEAALAALVPLIDSGTAILITNVNDPKRRALYDGLAARGWRAGELGPLGVLRRGSG